MGWRFIHLKPVEGTETKSRKMAASFELASFTLNPSRVLKHQKRAVKLSGLRLHSP